MNRQSHRIHPPLNMHNHPNAQPASQTARRRMPGQKRLRPPEERPPEPPLAPPPPRLPLVDKHCKECRDSQGSDKLAGKGRVLEVRFDAEGRFVPLDWEALMADPQMAGLLAGVDRDRFEQDQQDMGYVRCRRSATDPSWRQSLQQQERQLEGFHGQHHRGWGELGRHRNKKIVFVTHNGMARLLVDEYGTHVLEPPPPPGAAAPPPSDGVGSLGRLLPRGLPPAEAGKRPIVFEPEWQPVIHPVTVCEALFGEAAARRLRAIMLSANFQHCNIQFHQDQAVEGDGHGSRIATLCLRRPAVIQLHSYTTHLTYAFHVEPGDMWAMAGPVLYERSAEGETAWTWAHGVDMAEGRVPGEHHAECRECRISLNYRYLEEGSDQPALTRRALAAKGVVVLGATGGAGAVAKEEEKDGVGGGGGKRTRTR